MAKVMIVTGDAAEKLDELKRRSPSVFALQMTKYLTAGAVLIQQKSTEIAKREARGTTGNYMGAFTIDQIKKDEMGELFVKIRNLMDYSRVLEEGGVWHNAPPPMVMDEWIKKTFLPKTQDEVRSIAIAIGKMLVKRSKSGKGQRLRRSKSGKQGALLTMTRALKENLENLRALSSRYVDEGLAML